MKMKERKPGLRTNSYNNSDASLSAPLMRDTEKEPLLLLMKDTETASESNNRCPDLVRDKYHGVYIIMLIQGMGNLLAWNALINAAPYYDKKLCGSPYASSFENTVVFSYNATQLVCLLFMIKRGGTSQRSQHAEIIFSLSLNSLVFLGMAALAAAPAPVAPAAFAGLTLGGALIAAICTAFHQAAITAAASALPPSNIQAIMTGQAVVGLANALVALATDAGGGGGGGGGGEEEEEEAGAAAAAAADPCGDPGALDTGALLYFFSAFFMLILTLGAYFLVVRLPYFRQGPPKNKSEKYHYQDFRNYEHRADSTGDENGNVLLITNDYCDKDIMLDSQRLSVPMQDRLHEQKLGDAIDSSSSRSNKCRSSTLVFDSSNNEEDFPSALKSPSPKLGSKLSKSFQLVIQIFPSAAAVCVTFGITLMLFPSLTAKIAPSFTSTFPSAFFLNKNKFVLLSFVNFNLGDLVGRVLSAKFQMRSSLLLVFSLLRIIFLPLFLYCNVEGSHLPTLFVSNIYPVVFMFLFAASNGYVISLGMMQGPQLVKPPEAGEASTLMVFFLVLGLVVGSSFSFLAVGISTGHI